MDKNYGGVIWTNHALKRMRDRGIKQGDAWATWRRPDQSRYAKSRGTWVYYRTFPSTSSGQAQKIEIVAKKNEEKEWIIISVWSRKILSRKKNDRRKKSALELFFGRFLGRKR